MTLVALTFSQLPESELQGEATVRGLSLLKKWLRNPPPDRLHHKGMLVWISRQWKDLVPAEQQVNWRKELLAAQRPDGGWRLVDLGGSQWKRPEDSADALPTDAYATAFSVFFLRNSGLPSNHPAIQKGLDWLRKHQRQSGRWFTRSPHRDGHHFISHAATHFALLAFDSCQIDPNPPPPSD